MTWVASWPPARGDRDLDSHVRAEIARRYRRCLQATHGRSQLRERAVQIPEISIAPGIVLIRPWERERRPGAGDVSPRGVGRALLKSGFKAGRMPRPNVLPHDPRPSPGTLTPQYRQPTPWHAWVGPNRHAGRQPPHSEDGQRSPPLWRLSPSYLQHTPRPPASWHGSGQDAPKHSAARQG